MAETLVTLVLNKLSAMLTEAPTLLKGIRDNARYIADELAFMKYFIRGVDAYEDRDFEVEVMAKRMRDLAYDMEDALDEFRLQMSHNDGHGRWIQNVFVNHRFASKLRDIRTRLAEIGEQHRRYLIGKNILEQSSYSKAATRPEARLRSSFLLDEYNPVGIEKHKRLLINWLLNGNSELEVVSVVGMGGLGKTTLVKAVYNDAEVKNHFQLHAWITVSQSFNIEKLLIDMIRQLLFFIKEPVPEGMDYMDLKELRLVIRSLICSRRYLVVLDDVWDTSICDAMESLFPRNNYGSRVLLTTRKARIASRVQISNKIHHLEPLSAEESWALFCKRAFQSNSCPPYLMQVSQAILSRCEGLPLAIVAISGILAEKDRSIDEWEMAYRGISSALDDNDGLRSIKMALSLSYSDLPHCLKSCLLYFIIFPGGSPIRCMRLVRLWIAEGFVEERQGMTLEEVAHEYLSELIQRSLVQVVETSDDGRIRTCRIHDLLCEIMVSKSRDQGFAATVTEPTTMLPEKVRRVSIHTDMPSLRTRVSSSGLRSLFMFLEAYSSSQPPILNLDLRHLRLLTVLDLEAASIAEFPKGLTILFLLKYLSLRSTQVSSIPSSIRKLKILETLDLKHAKVTELPIEILKLQKLRHLLVYRYNFEVRDGINTKYGFRSLARLGNLQSIQKLCYVEANNNIVVELGRLIQLRRLGIIKLRKEDGQALCSSIEKLIKLHALSVTSVDREEIIDMEGVSTPPPFLQRLYLDGRLERLPNWISAVSSLVKVVLRWSRLNDDPLQLLQYLPNLLHLELVGAYDGELISIQANGFERLNFLGLNSMEGLQRMVVEHGAMPHLGRLVMQNCKSLQRLPLGIEHLSELNVLDLINMPAEFIERLQPNGMDGEYERIQHVLQVYCTFWNNGNWEIISVDRNSSDDKYPGQHDRYVWK